MRKAARASAAWCMWLAFGCLAGPFASGATNVTLADIGASRQRWMDIGDTLYAESYRNSYSYSQAHVVVSYQEHADTFVGRLVAANLKPHFAYQIKLEATAGTACEELLGSVGRYWQEEWTASGWDGWNLNNKGTGYAPTPNDLAYLAGREVVDEDSPTGLKYRYSMYMLLAYFVTDEDGNAVVDLELNSSYHVLWRDGWGRIRTASDGPSVTHTFAPSASSPAYDSDGAEQTIPVFGEWERLPMGGQSLPAGEYDVTLMLTEESFHQNTAYSGYWTKVMAERLVFSCGTAPVFTVHPESQLARTGDSLELMAALRDSNGCTISWRKDGANLETGRGLALSLDTVTAAAAGTYVCVAANDFGESQSQAAAVMVRDDLRTEAEYTQALGERDATIASLRAEIGTMYTVDELAAAVAEARPDSDGDGFTDQQELERETDPDSYTIHLAPGWNLVSLARVPEDNSVQGIFGTSTRGVVGQAWTWNPATLRYQTATELQPQLGHWLYWDGEETEIEIALPEHAAVR